MSEITRFDKDMDGSMEPSENGRWVMFDDVRDTARRLEVAQRLADALRLVESAAARHEIGVMDVAKTCGGGCYTLWDKVSAALNEWEQTR